MDLDSIQWELVRIRHQLGLKKETFDKALGLPIGTTQRYERSRIPYDNCSIKRFKELYRKAKVLLQSKELV